MNVCDPTGDSMGESSSSLFLLLLVELFGDELDELLAGGKYFIRVFIVISKALNLIWGSSPLYLNIGPITVSYKEALTAGAGGEVETCWAPLGGMFVACIIRL